MMSLILKLLRVIVFPYSIVRYLMDVKYLNYFVVDLLYVKFLRKEMRSKKLSHLNDKDFTRKSDKVFIFGGGESISHLCDEDWDYIRQFDTAALNYFYVHKFVPDMMFVELNDHKGLVDLFYSQCLNDTRFSNCHLVLQYKHARKTGIYSYPKPVNNFTSYVPYHYPANSQRDLGALLKHRKPISCDSLIHHASHVGALVDYCVKLGYEEIVLVGVDLNGGKYFYEVDSASQNFPNSNKYEQLALQRNDFFKAIGENNLNNHQSMDKSLTEYYHNLTILEYFEVMKSHYPAKLSVYNSDSNLVSTLGQHERS